MSSDMILALEKRHTLRHAGAHIIDPSFNAEEIPTQAEAMSKLTHNRATEKEYSSGVLKCPENRGL